MLNFFLTNDVPNKGGYFKIDASGNRTPISARQAQKIFDNLGDAYKVELMLDDVLRVLREVQEDKSEQKQ